MKSPYIDQFCTQHAVLNSTTYERQVAQRKCLLEFEAFIAPKKVEEAVSTDIQDYMALLIANGLHVNTVRKYRYMLQPFYRWLRERDVIDRMRWLDIKDVSNPRGSTGRGKPNPYSRKELMRFWQELEATYPRTSEHMLARWRRGQSRWIRVWRHYERIQLEAIVALALYGGLRAREIHKASIDDIHPDNEFIVVRYGKRSLREAALEGRVREVPYADSARRLIDRWLDVRETMAPEHDKTWLTLGRYDHWRLYPMSGDHFKAMMQRIGGWHLHRFRHSCATEWLRAGMPLEEVQRLLGHGSIQQTLAYAKLVPDDIARSIRRFQSRFEQAIGRPEEDSDDAQEEGPR